MKRFWGTSFERFFEFYQLSPQLAQRSVVSTYNCLRPDRPAYLLRAFFLVWFQVRIGALP